MPLAHSMEQQSSTKPTPASQAPITSSWCKRALRPLTSIIVRLEKHWKATPLDEKQGNAVRVPERAVNVKPTRSSRESQRKRDCVSESESSPDDPTWVPAGVGKKRIKYRYSGRKQSGGTGRPRVVPRSPETEKLRPGEFTISTPLVLGKGRKIHDDDDNGPGETCQARTPCPEEQLARNFSKRKSWPPSLPQRDSGDQYSDPGYVAIIQGILGVWNTFLKMTADEHGLSSGARSLTLMALNKTSEYILREQEYQNNLEDKDEEVDVADFIITELERTYALSDRGWKPLKALVRAHGIRLVCEAVRRKWIPPWLCRQLVLIAENVSSFDAAESLLSVLLSSTPSMPPPGRLDSSLFSVESSIGINMLHIYADKSGRRGFLFRDLAALISCGALPVEWMATESARTFVAGAIQSISSDNGWAVHAAQFIATVLCVASRTQAFADSRSGLVENLRHSEKDRSRFSQPRLRTKQPLTTSTHFDERSSDCDDFISTALSNTVSSIITILTAAHLARCNPGSSVPGASDSPMHRVISLASTIVQREIELSPIRESGSHSRIRLLRMGQVLLADFMLRCMERKRDTTAKSPAATTEAEEKVSSPHTVVGSSLLLFLGNFEYFLGCISNRGDLVSEFSQLVLQISRCWGRVHGGDGFSQVKRLTEALSSHTSTKTTAMNEFPVLRAVLNKVAVDVALNFAELTCLREHHVWALNVQETVSTSGIEMELERCNGLSGPGTPSLALSATGFSWEDGIGEWVARSPVMARQNNARGGIGHTAMLRSYSPLSSRETSVASGDASDHEETTSTLPSSVGEEEYAATRWNVDDDTNVSDPESPSLSGAKRKPLPGGVLSAGGDNKRRKRTPSSTPRYGLRRRRTVSGCGFYVDGGNHNGGSGDSVAPERLLPTRRDARVSSIGANRAGQYLEESESMTSPRCTVARHGRHPRPRSGCTGVEVEVRISAISASRKTKVQGSTTTDFEVVVPQNDRHKYYGYYSLPETKDEVGSAGGSDDDIFVSAPVLRDRIALGKRRRPHPPGTSPESTFSPSCKLSPAAAKSVSVNRSLRPRRPRPQVTDEVPCSESSEDELSFM